MKLHSPLRPIAAPNTGAAQHWLLTALLWLVLLMAWNGAAADPVGEVVYVQGVATAQQSNQAARFLTKGDRFETGDVLRTPSRGYAIVRLNDGTRMTLRPETEFAVTQFAHGKGEESMVMNLVRGGLRAITGLISKRNPQAGVRLQGQNATVGIRGTEFDARICGDDCREESRSLARERRGGKTVAIDPAIARVIAITGSAVAIDTRNRERTLTKGAGLYQGDRVRTAKGSWAVAGFRDRSIVTVTPESELKLEQVQFNDSASDTYVVDLVKGAVRALTGLIGKKQPSAVRFKVASATVGIRGTGMDIALAEHCVTPTRCAPSAYVLTWQGANSLDGNNEMLEVLTGQGGVFNPLIGKPQLLDPIPPFLRELQGPRPDEVEADFDNLFAITVLDDYPPGFYWWVRDGHVNLAADGGAIDLGRDEAGVLIVGSDRPLRIDPIPDFMREDPYPIPSDEDDGTRLIDLLISVEYDDYGICSVE